MSSSIDFKNRNGFLTMTSPKESIEVEGSRPDGWTQKEQPDKAFNLFLYLHRFSCKLINLSSVVQGTEHTLTLTLTQFFLFLSGSLRPQDL